MSRHRSQSFSKQPPTPHREKAERRGGSGVGPGQGVVYEPLIFRSLLSTRWRFSSTQGLKATSEDASPKMCGDQGQGQSSKESASTSRLPATTLPQVPSRTSSRSHQRAQEGVSDTSVSGKKVAAHEQSSPGARRRKESVSIKARPKEPAPDVDLAGSLKATSKLATQKLKPPSPSEPPKRTASAPAGVGSEDEPKTETPEQAATPIYIGAPTADSSLTSQPGTVTGKPPSNAGKPETTDPSSTLQPGTVTGKPPSSAGKPETADLVPAPSDTVQTKPSAGAELSVTPNKPAPEDCQIGAEPPSNESEMTQALTAELSVTAAMFALPAEADLARAAVLFASTGRLAMRRVSPSPATSRPPSTRAPPAQTLSEHGGPQKPEDTMSASESLDTLEARASSAPPASTDAERNSRRRKPNGLYYKQDVAIEAHASQKFNPSAKAAPKPRLAPSAPPTAVKSIDKKPKGAKRVRFDVEITHEIEVHPARRMRPLSTANFGTRSGLSYLNSPQVDLKKADKLAVKFPQGNTGTTSIKQLLRRQQKQVAVAAYWLRTEEEEAAERAQATVRAEEEAARYSQEPSPAVESASDVDCRGQATVEQTASSIAAEDGVELSAAAVPGRGLGLAVPEGPAKKVICATTRQEPLLFVSITEEMARIRAEDEKSYREVLARRMAEIRGRNERRRAAGEPVIACRKGKMRPLFFPTSTSGRVL